MTDRPRRAAARRPGPKEPDALPVEIGPAELAQLRNGFPSDIVIVDVREPVEWDICHIEGSRFIPLMELSSRVSEIDRTNHVVTLCHHGQRSLFALQVLRSVGFERIQSLRGGIDAWARQVDRSTPRY